MKYIVIYAFVFLAITFFSIVSCSTSSKSNLTLGINDSYKLAEGEKPSSNKNASRVLNYNELFNKYEDAQIPLHKMVEGNSYDMYFGIPVSLNKTLNRTGYYFTFINDSSLSVIKNNADEKKYYNKILRKNDSLYISTEIIENISKASYYIVHIVGHDSTKISNMHESDYVYSKLSFK